MKKQTKQVSFMTVTTGNYDAEVIAIDYAYGYPEGEAFDVYYKLWDYNHKGYSYVYFERYLNTNNDKCNAFFSYLNSIGIDKNNVKEYIGVNEILVLKNEDGVITTEYRTYVGKPKSKEFRFK